MSEETCLPCSILLPTNLLRWSCKLCRDFRMKPSEQLVTRHIGEVHGAFFLASSSSGSWWSAVCSLCQVEGTGEMIRQHEEQHRREGFAREEDGEVEIPSVSTRGSSVQVDQISAYGARAKEEKRERSPSIEVLKETGPKIRTKKSKGSKPDSLRKSSEKVKRKNRSPSSSSTSSSSSSSPTSSSSSSSRPRQKSKFQQKLKKARKSKSRPQLPSPEYGRSTHYLPQREAPARSRSLSRSPSSPRNVSSYPTRARDPRERESYYPWRGRRGRSRSGSPRRVSPRRNRLRSPESSAVQRGSQPFPGLSSEEASQSSAGDFMIVGVGTETKFKCEVCSTLSNSKLQHDQHKGGLKHRKALVPGDGDGNCAAPNYSSPGTSAAALQCPACQQDFEELAQLKDHVKNNHDILLTCTECEARGYNPRGEALFCQELIEHYSQVHHKKITVSDLPYYGKKGGEKMRSQGYVVCRLCPRPSYLTLGRPGLWFTNQLSLTIKTIRSHFTRFHPWRHNFLDQIRLGCQLCQDQLPGSRDPAQWRALLNKHEEGESSGQPSPGSVLTQLCPYCGETVPREGEAAQRHIRQRHRELTFSCNLCDMSDRYLYQALEDVFRHLRLKHFGVAGNKMSNIILPGSQSNLEAFAWVKCKICDFRGIGGGEEVRNHLQHHQSGGQENLDIFCRLCHRDDRNLVDTFQNFEEYAQHFKADHGDIVRILKCP